MAACLGACLMRGQKSPMVKGKVDAAFSRLDRLDLGEGVADAQESILRADLFASVCFGSLSINHVLTP